MEDSRKKPAVVGIALLILLGGLWLVFKRPAGEDKQPLTNDPASEKSERTRPPGVSLAGGGGPIRSTRTNPVKAALRNSPWKIVARNSSDAQDASEPTSNAAAESAAPSGINSTKLSLEFVRANFDAAGMRGVEKFAAFSPPQYLAIKKALEKHSETDISAAPVEYAPDGEPVNYDLVNAEDDREFSVQFTPSAEKGNKTIRLHLITDGATRQRDTTLTIWDGQTVMIPLGGPSGTHTRLALLITARLMDEDGKPVNNFEVK